jgi:hypothetical protein
VAVTVEAVDVVEVGIIAVVVDVVVDVVAVTVVGVLVVVDEEQDANTSDVTMRQVSITQINFLFILSSLLFNRLFVENRLF